MTIHWGVFWTRNRKSLKVCCLIAAAVVAFYAGVIRPQERNFGIASSRATGLASEAGASWAPPLSLWRQASFFNSAARMPMLQKGVSVRARLMSYGSSDADKSEQPTGDRKLVRTASLSLIVKSPAQCAGKIVRLAQDAGGFLVSSQISGGADAVYASLSIRVPTERFEAVSTQIRSFATHVEEDNLESEDVTRQYVDDDARLRNLRAQEQQYLGILRKAASIKDTLEVSDKLNQVRGAIEEKQAEFAALSKRVETVALNISLRGEAEAQVFGLHWRPLYQLKSAAREGLNGLGDYAASMTFFAFYLPTIALWLFTIFVVAAICWRILRWAARVFFRSAKVLPPEGALAQ